jgi:predicted transposase/invertase (TIGR01784 family)
MYTSDMRVGEKYEKLNRCVAISILDFNLDDREAYNNAYRFRDAEGHEFTDAMEIRTIELRKKLSGDDPVNDWIRFFNAKTEEDLEMIKTKNAGIQEAIQMVREMSLSHRLRILHEARQKEERDRQAREEYVWDEGLREGKEAGLQEGLRQGIMAYVSNAWQEGASKEQLIQNVEKIFAVSTEEASRYVEEGIRQDSDSIHGES